MTDANPYLDKLLEAAEWALDETLPAWDRALDATETTPPRYQLDDLLAVREQVMEQAPAELAAWLEVVVEKATPSQLEALLEMTPDWVWYQLVCMNSGLFALNGDPLTAFQTYIPSVRPLDNPLYLSPCPDGFGLRIREH